ncbi:hypothetical protein phiA019_0014 [Aeromonas phage phiA019]|nr:hypothetical protein phiA009_0018 [Aeromonas phage phiA009]ULG01551.1 hypothetical protein phiA019_0014 [Aeromonas phage phiA019]
MEIEVYKTMIIGSYHVLSVMYNIGAHLPTIMSVVRDH